MEQQNKKMPARRNHPLQILALQAAVLLFSATGIFTKLASREPFLSLKFILFYGIAIFLMFVYALLWQQFLKLFPLSTAYANKSVATVWTMLFGYIFFHEEIRLTMVIGAAIIIVGVYLVVTADA